MCEDDDVRTRLIDAAERCFYRVGVNASGVDTLAAEAGVSKRTLYNQFGSKEGLLAAYLEMREARWRRRLDELLAEAGNDPLDRVLAYVRGHAVAPVDDVYRGSAMINLAAELPGVDDPALVFVQRSLDGVRDGVRRILVAAGVPARGATRLAAQVQIVIEGAVAVGGVHRDPKRVLIAAELVRELLEPVLARTTVVAGR